MTDATTIRIDVATTGAGGSPSARCAVQMDSVTLVADVSTGTTYPASGTVAAVSTVSGAATVVPAGSSPPVLAGAASNAGNTDYAVSVPAGTVDGDLLIVLVASDWDTLANNPIPTGFTSLPTASYDGGSNAHHLAAGWRFASSEPASYTVVIGSGTDSAAAILRVTGAEGTPTIVQAAGSGFVAGSGTVDSPSLSPNGATDLLIAWAAPDGDNGSGAVTLTQPPGMTLETQAESGAWQALAVASLQSPTDPSGTKTWTLDTGGHNEGSTGAISIAPAGGGGGGTTYGASGTVAAVSTVSGSATVVPAGSGTTYTDDFNRPDVNLALESGGAGFWNVLTGTWEIISNELAVTAGSGGLVALGRQPVTTDDNWAEIVFTTLGSASAGPVVRSDSAGNRFYLWRNDGSTWQLYVNNAGSVYRHRSAYSAAAAPGDVARVEANGTTIKGYVNGVERASATDSTITTGKYVGLRIYASAGARFDDFAGGDLGPAALRTAPRVPLRPPAR